MHPSLQHCPECSSFTPKAHSSCVHCGASLVAQKKTSLKDNRFKIQTRISTWSKLKKRTRPLMQMGGVAFVSMTLSACYGQPLDYEGERYDFRLPPGSMEDASVPPVVDQDIPYVGITCTDPSLDLDDDGYCGDLDCDEADPFVHANLSLIHI